MFYANIDSLSVYLNINIHIQIVKSKSKCDMEIINQTIDLNNYFYNITISHNTYHRLCMGNFEKIMNNFYYVICYVIAYGINLISIKLYPGK